MRTRKARAAILALAILVPAVLFCANDSWEDAVAGFASPDLELRAAAARDLQAHMDRLRKKDPRGFLEGMKRLEALRDGAEEMELRDKATALLARYQDGGGVSDPWRGGGVLWRLGPDRLPGPVTWWTVSQDRLIAVGDGEVIPTGTSWIAAFDPRTGKRLWQVEIDSVICQGTVRLAEKGLLCGGFVPADENGVRKGWAAIYDPASGKPLVKWKDLPGPPVTASSCDKGVVVAGFLGESDQGGLVDVGGWIAFLDTAARKMAWSRDLPGPVYALHASGSEIVAGGQVTSRQIEGTRRVSGGATNGWLAAFSALDGKAPVWVREGFPGRVDRLERTGDGKRVLAAGRSASAGTGLLGWASLLDGASGKTVWERTGIASHYWNREKPQGDLLPGLVDGVCGLGKLADGRLYLCGPAWRRVPPRPGRPVGLGIQRDRGWLWILGPDGSDAGEIDCGEMPGPVRSVVEGPGGRLLAGGGIIEEGGHVSGWLAALGIGGGKAVRAWEERVAAQVSRLDDGDDGKAVAVVHRHVGNEAMAESLKIGHGMSVFDAASGKPVWRKMVQGRDKTATWKNEWGSNWRMVDLSENFGLDVADAHINGFKVGQVRIWNDMVLAAGTVNKTAGTKTRGWLAGFRLRDSIPEKYPASGSPGQ